MSENNVETLTTKADTLESEIKAFAESLEYWLKSLCAKLLSSTAIAETDIDIAYSHLLESAGLKEKSKNPDIEIKYSVKNNIYKNDLLLSELRNLEGINALADNQKIEFSHNLTVIYGANGAGKTGYTRLMKEVFFSRSQEEIIPNVHATGTKKNKDAEFTFVSGSKSYKLKYADYDSNSEFKQFAVFDGKCVLLHLDERNEFEFRPAGLNFFAEISELVKEIEEKLKAEANSKFVQEATYYPSLFEGDSEIKTILSGISAATKIEDLKKHTPFTKEDSETKQKLTKEHDDLKLAYYNKAKEIKDLNNNRKLINDLKVKITQINKLFTEVYIKQIQGNIKDYLAKLKTQKDKGIQQFKSDKIKNIGSAEWKKFIEAAEKFAQQQSENYPESKDSCLLCHQNLSPESKNLIESYWGFIKSQIEQEVKAAQTMLNTARLQYEGLKFDLFPDENILTKWLTDNYPQLFLELKAQLAKQKQLSDSLIQDIENIKEEKRDAFQIDTSILDKAVADIDNKIKALNEGKESEVLAEKLKPLTYLNHKEKLGLHLKDIEKYVNNLKWIEKAEKINFQSIKKKITEAEKKLSAKYFNQRYIDIFNEECLELKGDFGIDVNPKSSGAKTNRQLQIKGRNPSHILSEGEQKVIALADFLSEMKISDINRCLIFDDPVSSLDEERKDNIAKKLVLDSKDRQIIIFTHDLVFLSSIFNYCKDYKVESRCHWIQCREKTPGFVFLDNAPSLEKNYNNSQKAKELYAKAKNSPPEEQEHLIKSAFSVLRTCYEALVIFGLFKGVVQRFNERISVESLKDVVFDQTIVDEIMDSYASCCRYMEGHSHSDKYAAKKPTIENLDEEINKFDSLKPKLADIKKKAAKTA